jgi:hypothetical protein
MKNMETLMPRFTNDKFPEIVQDAFDFLESMLKTNKLDSHDTYFFLKLVASCCVARAHFILISCDIDVSDFYDNFIKQVEQIYKMMAQELDCKNSEKKDAMWTN